MIAIETIQCIIEVQGKWAFICTLFRYVLQFVNEFQRLMTLRSHLKVTDSRKLYEA